MDEKAFKLRNGVEVPFIGFGTGDTVEILRYLFVLELDQF